MPNFLTHNDLDIPAHGSSLLGHLTASYRDMLDAFGEPDLGIPGESQVEWRVKFPDGSVATIYDRHELKDVRVLHRTVRWHVGGYHLRALGLVSAALRDSIDNYDGPDDGDAWAGGFARNH